MSIAQENYFQMQADNVLLPDPGVAGYEGSKAAVVKYSDGG